MNSRPKYSGPGMTFGNMREQGVRHLSVYCRDCHHWPLLNVDHMPDDVEVQSIDRRLVCSRCGSVGKSDVMPNWSERPARPSLTGSQYE
jgi:hypothetical protein